MTGELPGAIRHDAPREPECNLSTLVAILSRGDVESMTAAALLDEILRLPPADRLRLLHEIANSLHEAAGPISQEIKDELDRRDADPLDDADTSLDEVLARLRSRTK